MIVAACSFVAYMLTYAVGQSGVAVDRPDAAADSGTGAQLEDNRVADGQVGAAKATQAGKFHG
ncbi:hypothetical protein [Microbacterium sp.]|uniref:hypothetical protein n=1 Tax=Microbacterium sp. TaxID=51671 RepID=UPI003A8F2C3D